MLRRIIVAVAMVMALAVLGLLMYRTQAQPLDLRRHNERLTQLERVLELEAAVDQDIARARLALDAEPPGLEQAQQRLAEARQQLRQGWMPRERLAPEIDGPVREYFRHADEKSAALERYRAELQQFFAAFGQLRKQADPVLTVLASDQYTALRRRVMTLLGDLTTYSIQSRPINGPEIAELQGAISSEARGLPPAALQTVDRLLASADAVRSTKDGLQDRMQELLALPTTPALERARRNYHENHARTEASTARYRKALAIYASALLLVFALGGWRLRRSYAELDGANAHLEELVDVRTQELRKALDEVRSQQAQLIQSEKMASLGQLVAGVAHEINTPLGYARSNVETVREGLPAMRSVFDAYDALLPLLPASQAEALLGQLQAARKVWDPVERVEEADVLLADAEHGLVQIADLVMSLKDFSRVDRSLTERFDINQGLETALKICQGHLKSRVEIRREFGELPLVPCAPSQLNQVFLNLITNAAQAIDGAGWIQLSTREVGDAVEISIADSGCGMDEQTQAHIFEPFFTTKDVGKGTGLGLSIVFRILEDHHGSIEVRSAPGQGAEFIIRLPTAREAPAQPRAAPIASVAQDDELLPPVPAISGI
ncbi:MAG TPA: ATP-binding protein [Solimonas sp.]|nr:ATP-binding protein [Solimonas sp.]